MLPARLQRPLLRIASPPAASGLLRGGQLLLWETYDSLHGLAARSAVHRSRGKRSARTTSPTDSPIPEPAFFREHVTNNLLPFWLRHAVDDTFGGFFNTLVRDGRLGEDPAKYTAMQARMVYAFSAGYEITGDRVHLAIAQQAAAFLISHMWDPEFGGWYRSVTREGALVDPGKRMIDQSFSMVGLLEFHRVTGDEAALALSLRTHQLLLDRGWNERDSGYFADYARDWTVTSHSYTACFQLDMLAALIALWKATGDPEHLQQAERVGEAIAGRMVAKRRGWLLETFRPGWRYDPLITGDRVDIGHQLKAGWLLADLHRETGDVRWLGAARRLVDLALRYGWDPRAGGFYYQCYRNRMPASDVTLWWVQCEGLIALSALLAIEDNPRYRRALWRLLDFCFGTFVDHEFGEWYLSCRMDGTVIEDRKGYEYKAAYHTVEACALTASNLEARSAVR